MKKCDYYYPENIKLISEDNIGKNGENLTIVILCYNKATLTIRLLDSIKKKISNFKGKILLFDNNSDIFELNILRDYLKNFKFNVEIFNSKINLGISGGRKKAFSLVKTNWIMSLDNDVFFIKNPLKSLNECVEVLGSKIINLSIYDDYIGKNLINGCNFIIEKKDKIYINVGTVFNNGECSSDYFLSTGSTGILVINKKTYDLVGGYDENFFVGYEDIDFSIRCYRLGLKIGNINSYFLVHNHEFLNDGLSKKYEKERYNIDILTKSNDYFKRKYNDLFSAMSDYDKEFLDKMQEKINK